MPPFFTNNQKINMHKIAKTVPKAAEEKVSTAIIIKSLEANASPALKRLKKIEAVNTQEDYDIAAANIKALKLLAAEAEKQREKILGPLKEVTKEVNALFKPFTKMVDDTEAQYKKLMLQYVAKVEAEREKVERDYEAGKIKKISTYTERAAAATVKSGNGAANIRKVWKVEIERLAEVPSEYMVPDIKAIKEALEAGKKVKGCKLVQDSTIAI